MSKVIKHTVLDTETTGMTSDDRIIEIGAILLENRRPVKTFQAYLNPENRSSHPEALKVHGITDDFLKDKPTFSEVYHTFLDFINDSTLVIHNAAFDMRFLQYELDRVAYPVKLASICPVCDTIKLAKEQFPGQKYNLDALCRRFGIDISHRSLHGALKDADLLVKVFLQLTHNQSAFGLASNDGNTESREQAPWKIPIEVIAAENSEVVEHVALLKKLGLEELIENA